MADGEVEIVGGSPSPAPRRRKRPRIEIDLTKDGGGAVVTGAPRRPVPAPVARAVAPPRQEPHQPEVVDMTEDDPPTPPPVAAMARAAPASAAAASARPAPNKRPLDVVMIDDDEDEDDMHDPVEEVLKVFPDCAINHLKTLLEARGGDAQSVIDHLCENPDYPRSKSAGPTPPPSKPPASSDPTKLHMTHEVMARYLKLIKKGEEYMERSSDTSERYREHAMLSLSQAFPLVPLPALRNVFKDNGHRYFRTTQRLKELLYGDLLKPEVAATADPSKTEATVLQNIKKAGWRPLSKGRGSPQVRHGGGAAHAHGEVTVVEVHDTDFAAEKKFVEEYEEMESHRRERAQAEAKAVADAESKGEETIECGCCFGDYPFCCMVQCTEGHLFCFDCLRNYAKTRLFEEQRSTLPCMTSAGSEACTGCFPDTQCIQVLDPKVYLKLTELEGSAAVKAASLNLYECPYCDFPAEVDENVRWFDCPQCSKSTCVKCREDKHADVPCEQVERKKDTNVRTAVEEALTAAKLRVCPQRGCGTSFLKSDGCNKITCSKCGTLSCYICREMISKSVGYKHFCGTPHCRHEKCGKCSLWSSAEEDDARAMREAGLKAKEAASKAVAATSSTDKSASKSDEAVKDVDVDALMRAGLPPPGARRPGQPPPNYHPPPPFMPQAAHAGLFANLGIQMPHLPNFFPGVPMPPPPPPPPPYMPHMPHVPPVAAMPYQPGVRMRVRGGRRRR